MTDNSSYKSRSSFIAGIFDHVMFSKKDIGENIENGFFEKIIKDVDFYSDEIVVIFTCLRFEIYIFVNTDDKLRKIYDVFLKNKLKILLQEKDIIDRLTHLCSGELSEITGELQIREQVINTFESHLEEKSNLKNIFYLALKNSDLFRKSNNFYNNDNYATIALKIINDSFDKNLKSFMIIGAGMISKEFAKACNSLKDKINSIVIADIEKKKSKELARILEIKNIEIIDIQQINIFLNKVDAIFVAAGGKYKIYGYKDPLFIVDITCPPMLIMENSPRTKIITILDDNFQKKINQINNSFNLSRQK
ncbi:MAG: hypothetical protein AAB451_04135 [Patescibacteria group bacterium]